MLVGCTCLVQNALGHVMMIMMTMIGDDDNDNNDDNNNDDDDLDIGADDCR